jgi:hypothetical protein
MKPDSAEQLRPFKTLSPGESVSMCTGKNNLGTLTLERDETLTYTTPDGKKWTLITKGEIQELPDREWDFTMGSLMDNVIGDIDDDDQPVGVQFYHPHIQLVAADATISRLHCRVVAHPGWVDVIDTSTNGLEESVPGEVTTPARASLSQIGYRPYPPVDPVKRSVEIQKGVFAGLFQRFGRK